MQPTTQPELTQAERSRIAKLTGEFHRSMKRRHEHDSETLSSVVRVLNNGRSAARADVERFKEFVRGILREELEKEKRC